MGPKPFLFENVEMIKTAKWRSVHDVFLHNKHSLTLAVFCYRRHVVQV